VIEEIISNSGTPYFSFKDIDENKPTGAIKIRIETIHYFLKRYREDMIAKNKKVMTIEEKMKEYEEKLRKQFELQEKLDEIHKKQGTAQYANGSLNGNAVEIDLSNVKNGNGNGNGHHKNGEIKKVTEEITV
jgi:TPP-dependent indolepyruvate ferredoxin oxidoreductase alpha subunit